MAEPVVPPAQPPVAAPQPAVAPPDAPRVYAGKYNSVEDLEKGYLAAQQKISAAPKPESALTLGGETANSPETIDFDTIKPDDIIAKTGFKTGDLESQYREKGELTPEQYAAFRKINPALGKAIVNQLADGMVAKANLYQVAVRDIKAKASAIAGGDEQRDLLLKTAAEFVPPEQLTSLQARLSDPKTALDAFSQLTWMRDTSDKSKPLVSGTGGGGTGVPTTKAEFSALSAGVRRGDVNSVSILDRMTVEQIKRFQ